MIKNKALMWAVVIGAAVSVLTSCKLDMPKETETSFETMVVDTTDIETPMKFSAKMKGRADVTISPQVSGQLMKIYVTAGQQVRRGQTLFVIDSRNAQLSEALNMYSGAQAVIALYIALGGATK